MSLASADLRGFMKKLDLTEARIKGRVTDTYRKLVTAVFVDIVKHTPQFTGNLAYGWEIVFGPYTPTNPRLFSPGERDALVSQAYRGDFEPYERGDDPAVEMVLSRELDKLAALRYNSIVRIVNNVEYAEDVDQGRGPDGNAIRPENLTYGKVFMTSYAAIKYNRMRNLLKVTA